LLWTKVRSSALDLFVKLKATIISKNKLVFSELARLVGSEDFITKAFKLSSRNSSIQVR